MKTIEQVKREYVQSEGKHCPYCESIDIDGYGDMDMDASYVWRMVRCNACGKEWRDIYVLYTIDLEDEL